MHNARRQLSSQIVLDRKLVVLLFGDTDKIETGPRIVGRRKVHLKVKIETMQGAAC